MGVDTNDLYPEGEATKAPPSSHISFKLSLADELRCVICPARECPLWVESRQPVKCVRVSQQQEVRWRHAHLTTLRNEPSASASSAPGPKKRQSETRKGPRSGERPKVAKRLRPTVPKGNRTN